MGFVRASHSFRHRSVGEQGNDWAENLFAGDGHFVSHAGEKGGREETAGPQRGIALKRTIFAHDFRAVSLSAGDQRTDILTRFVVDQRAGVHAFAEPIADFRGGEACGDLIGEGRLLIGVDKDAVGRDADLAGNSLALFGV